MDRPAESDRADDGPLYVEYLRPRCPTCGSVRLRAHRSTQNGDGTVTRHSRCLDCGQRLFVVAE